MSTRFGVITFPGTCDDTDALRACDRVGEGVALWHADADLHGVDAVVIPGGFSYGDHLRVGAVARFSPVMGAVAEFARAGGPVLGICNGFQILCEARLLPGALLPNTNLRFSMRQTTLEVLSQACDWTASLALGETLSIPAKHGAGRWFAPPETVKAMDDAGQLVLRYADDPLPNGSLHAIAGVCNDGGNVLGLMPHPEHAADALTGSADGLKLFGAVTGVAAT